MWHMCSYTKTNRGDKCDSMAPDPDKFNPNTNVTPDVKNGRICHTCDKCDLCKMYGNSRIYCPWCREWHFELSALGNSSKYHILHLGKRFDCFPKHPWFFYVLDLENIDILYLIWITYPLWYTFSVWPLWPFWDRPSCFWPFWTYTTSIYILVAERIDWMIQFWVSATLL